MKTPEYSLIIPVCNEEDTLIELYNRLIGLMSQLDNETEVILIDDGSNDRSYALMLSIHTKDPRFKIVHFSRNFGHQIAITAGMNYATGNAVIIMDADLQDPPEVVLEMVSRWREGYDIVYAVREERLGESWFKKITATLFYRLMQQITQIEIPVDAGDFRLVGRKALEAYQSLSEHNRYVRGLFSWIGFKQIGITYQRSARFAGKTKYSFKKMFKLAVDGMISFSDAPLNFLIKLGITMTILSLLGSFSGLLLNKQFNSFAWIGLLIVFVGGLQLVGMGFIGVYLSRIYDETRKRPLYIIEALHGLETKPKSISNPEMSDLKHA